LVLKPALERGQQALRRIAEIWQIDAKRTQWVDPANTRHPGFEWWPGDFRVVVRASFQDEGDNDRVRISIRTDVLRDVLVASETFAKMTASMSRYASSTYSWVYPSKSLLDRYPAATVNKLWFNAAAYIDGDNVSWMTDFFANASVIQPVNAQIQGRGMTELLGGTPDVSRPESLKDAGLDGLLEVVDQVFAPMGREPSRFGGSDEFEEFANRFGKSDNCFGMGDKAQLTLETPFGSDSALIRLVTSETHPQLGNGLLATLQLPFGGEALAAARHAAELNHLEAASWTDFPQLGCWHTAQNRDGEGPAFTLFVPNALYRPGIATNVALWFLARARWVRVQMFPNMVDTTMLQVLSKRLGRPPSLSS
jgi:hypothetical protein